MELDPEKLPVIERYKLLIGGVVPRPIAFVSTISLRGEVNLAPFSFFNGVGSDPMTMLFCPANKLDGSEKDTLINAKPAEEGGVGEFVVHAATEDLARQVAGAAEELPYGDSEVELTGLSTVPSRVVRPPRIAESPIAFECVTTQVIRTNGDAPLGGNVVLGRVVHIHLRDDLVDERRRIDPDRLQAIGRMGGTGYATTRDRFDLPRGAAALAIDDPFADD
ncbi:MAG: flavin reductase family protein [Acidobacteriota bacterium]